MEVKESLIYIDDLTGLFNRRYLYFQLEKELEIAKTQKYNLWLFMLDIDNFKIINDSYGHLCGDEILKDVAGVLAENTKSRDKKIRYAGDEFTIILVNVDAKDIVKVAMRLLTKIDAHHFKEKHSNKEIHLTISVGISGYPQDFSEATELINLADKALYISKQKGKNSISTASEITPDLFWKKDILERFPSPVVVARTDELSRLKDALSRAFESQGNMFLIGAELGLGKSRLLNEFESFILSKQVTCLSARCVDKFLTQPYYILGDVLDRYLSGLKKLPKELLKGIPDPQVVALAKFLPLLKDISGAPSVEDTALEERDCLKDGLIKLLLNISTPHKPLCLLLDDLHYLDAQSLRVILSLIQEHKQFPILIISTFCPEELEIPAIGPSPLVEVIKTEVFQRCVQTLTLNSLTAEGTQEMISHLLSGISLTPDFPGLIYKITQGNPLFVEELLKYLIEKEYILYQNGKWTQKEISESILPHSIEEAIKARIEDLSAETKEMIAKAAVIGEDFQVDLLQKIDSEDRGYILDLIETAKKIGLIYERGTGGKDEFSFVTNQTRNVLLGAIGGERTKHFYSRLGEIKEKLYSGKVNNIAGELYYNFKKAEDWARAEQYAKIIRESRGALYDRTLEYAQSLLEETAEEKMAQPLSKKTWTVIPELIRSIYIASVNYILYPAQNKMRTQSIEEVYKRLLIVFSEVGLLNVGYTEGVVFVNNEKAGKELTAFFSNAFISLLRNLDIESLIFKKGIGREELATFIELISSAESQEENLSELLQKTNVFHIKIKEITYATSKKKSKEKESLEEGMLIDYFLGRLPADEKKADVHSAIYTHPEEIAGALEKLGEEIGKKSGRDNEGIKTEIMAKSIQKIGSQLREKGPDDWEKYKAGFAKTLLSMEPNLCANILSSQIEDKVDILKEVSLEFPDEVAINLFTTLYMQKDINIEKIRNLAQRFLSAPSKKEKLIPILKEKFKKMGASGEECKYILEDEPWKGISAPEEANEILNLPIKTFLKILPIINIGSLIKELFSQNKEALVEAVAERLFSVLEEKHLESQFLVIYFKEILDAFMQNSPDILLPKFIQRLSKTCLNKNQPLSFFVSIASPYLDEMIQIFLNAEQLVLIKEIIQVYTKDAKIKEEQAKVFESFITPKLIKELTRRIELNLDWAGTLDILVLLKDQATKLLIEEAVFEEEVPEGKYFDAYLKRRAIGRILEQTFKEGLLSLLEERCSDPRLYIIKNLVELIGAMEDEEIIKILEVPLKHPDTFIRRKATFALRKRKGKNSARLLGETLKDEDARIRKEALRILKARNDDFSRNILKVCAQDKNLPLDIREAL